MKWKISNWNPDAKTLSGTSLGILNSAQNITVYSPTELIGSRGERLFFMIIMTIP